jgi:hypothetical protein
MDLVDYDFHSHMASTACPRTSRLHKRICLLVDKAPRGGIGLLQALVELRVTEAQLHTIAGKKDLAEIAMQEADAINDTIGDGLTRWIGVPVATGSVTDKFRCDCGRVRRLIEDLVGSSRTTVKYIQTATGLTKDARRQLTDIHRLASGGVHMSFGAYTLVFDTDAAEEYIRSLSSPTAWKADWRTERDIAPFKPMPSAFADTLKMRSCVAKVQTATLATRGW